MEDNEETPPTVAARPTYNTEKNDDRNGGTDSDEIAQFAVTQLDPDKPPKRDTKISQSNIGGDVWRALERRM